VANAATIIIIIITIAIAITIAKIIVSRDWEAKKTLRWKDARDSFLQTILKMSEWRKRQIQV